MLLCSLFLLTLLMRESQFVHIDIPGDRNNADTHSPSADGLSTVPESNTYSPADVLYVVFEDTLVCPPDPKTCNKYRRFKKTQEMVCYNSKDCDDALACCPDSCYKHKVCKEKIKRQRIPLAKKNAMVGKHIVKPTMAPFELVEGRVETCPSEKSPCAKPQDINKTERFKCVDQCPPRYKCCEDSCFAHKICKKANATTTKVYVQVPKHRMNYSDPETTTVSSTVSVPSTTPMISHKESQKSNETGVTEKPEQQEAGECPAENLVCSSPLHENDTKQFDCDKTPCPKNFFCCKDNCFAHKICKEASSSNGSDIRFSRKREICPTNEESCLLPADIKHAVFCPQENCTTGLKCCPDACFKRNVCKRPDILIETRIETCPEDPKVCDSFLRSVTIHPRFICSVNMSNCPEDTKCCSDSCHQADLCKPPEVHTVIQKLVPTTTYQGLPSVNDSQAPANVPEASGSQPVNGAQSPGASGSQPVNGAQSPGASGSQPVNGAQSPGDKPSASNSQTGNGSQLPGASGSQPVNGPQSPGSKPGASAGQNVAASPYKDDLQSPQSRESAESPVDHMAA